MGKSTRPRTRVAPSSLTTWFWIERCAPRRSAALALATIAWRDGFVDRTTPLQPVLETSSFVARRTPGRRIPPGARNRRQGRARGLALCAARVEAAVAILLERAEIWIRGGESAPNGVADRTLRRCRTAPEFQVERAAGGSSRRASGGVRVPGACAEWLTGAWSSRPPHRLLDHFRSYQQMPSHETLRLRRPQLTRNRVIRLGNLVARPC